MCLQIAEKIRTTVDRYQQAFPTLLEIPSKDHPYGEHQSRLQSRVLVTHDTNPDPSKDSVLKRVQKLFGE
jgi:V-type H+-transporting ATPase subunit F